MQTFLPYQSFVESAKVLDMRRLGKQRVEGYQILRTLGGASSGWKNHPAVKMWAGYEKALAFYTLTMCEEWVRRGFMDTVASKVHGMILVDDITDFPKWLGDERLHKSHQSNLLRKDPAHYGKMGWLCPINLPYFWPTKEVHSEY